MSPSRIYHERQVAQQCGLHALNNLFQRPNMFTKQQLDEYCNQLTPNVWLNPHRSWLGWGNYDVNVMMYALQCEGCEAIWFDRRRDPNCLQLDAIIGFILNVDCAMSVANIPIPIMRTRHWVALRAIDGVYYDLDSKLLQPRYLGNELQFLNFLRDQLMPTDNGDELLVIVPQSNVQEQLWLKWEYRGHATV